MLNNFFPKSCRLFDNVEKYGRTRQATYDSVTRRMRFARWITKATETHSEYLTCIAFSRQQWLHKPSAVLHYTLVACLVIYSTVPCFKLQEDLQEFEIVMS